MGECQGTFPCTPWQEKTTQGEAHKRIKIVLCACVPCNHPNHNGCVRVFVTQIHQRTHRPFPLYSSSILLCSTIGLSYVKQCSTLVPIIIRGRSVGWVHASSQVYTSSKCVEMILISTSTRLDHLHVKHPVNNMDSLFLVCPL